MRIAVVLLAGGAGRRIGGSKPLRRLGGERLIDRAAALARPWSDRIRVAVRPGGQLADCPVPVIHDDPAVEGPLGGVAAALRFAAEQGCEAVQTIPCDAPFLPTDLAPRLAGAIGEALAAVPCSFGRVHPACTLWRVSAAAALPGYLAGGRRSLAGFAAAAGRVEIAWDDAEPDPFFNINSDDDLAAAELLIRSR